MTKDSTLLKVMQLQQLAVYHNQQAAKNSEEANRLMESLREAGAATTASPRKGKLTKEVKVKMIASLNKSLYKQKA